MSFSPGYTVGYLEQEPRLDPEKTVKEIVQEGDNRFWTYWLSMKL